jgi:hypothetical protein
MTTPLVAARFFGGSHEHARALLGTPRYVPHMLSKSRFSRRLHRIAPLFQTLFALDTIRIPRARLYPDEVFRGYIPSKRRYFYGLRLCLLTTRAGEPVEAFLVPGSVNDTEAVKRYRFDLPPGSTIDADRGCTDYTTEDLLAEAQQVRLRAMRKKNLTRPVPPWTRYLQFHGRKMIETAGRLIHQLPPKSIHAVTPQGFELKVFLFVLAYSITRAL